MGSLFISECLVNSFAPERKGAIKNMPLSKQDQESFNTFAGNLDFQLKSGQRSYQECVE